MFKSLVNQIVFVIILAVFGGCSGEECFHTKGELITDEREVLQPFDSIIIRGEMNVIINQSYSPRVVLKGGSNILPWISTSFNGHILTITDQNECAFLRDLGFVADVYLTVTDIKYLSILSSGNIFSEGELNADTLAVEYVDGAGAVDLAFHTKDLRCQIFNGAANVRLSGETQNFYLYGDGFGPVNAENLPAAYLFVAHHGSNLIKVRATDHGTLNTEFFSNGNIGYIGNPDNISVKQFGDGKLIKL